MTSSGSERNASSFANQILQYWSQSRKNLLAGSRRLLSRYSITISIGQYGQPHTDRTINSLAWHGSFDIQDRKGLELVILTALLTFQDANDTYHTRDLTPGESSPESQPTTPPATAAESTLSGFFGLSRRVSEIRLDPPRQEVPPQLPPKPEKRTSVERIAELHALRSAQGEGEVNEVHVSQEGSVDDYARYAEKLLNASHLSLMLRLLLTSSAPTRMMLCFS